ncbi:uncharacterized protein METZ01_LOCUS192561 [marine metagenome]|uniref:Uncharacterized protein n=1 Tax=marine metagenome TaxID=408172 RepID=A0A382DQ41_9ZZZZ
MVHSKARYYDNENIESEGNTGSRRN